MVVYEILTYEYDLPLLKLLNRRMGETDRMYALEAIPDGVALKLRGKAPEEAAAEALAVVLGRDLRYFALAEYADALPLSLADKQSVLADTLEAAACREERRVLKQKLADYLGTHRTLTEDEPYDLCIGEPSPFGSAHGYYTVHGDALEPWGRYRVALELDDFDVSVQRDREWLIQGDLLLKLRRDMPCTLNGEKGLLEAGTYVYLVSYLDTFTEADLSTEDGLVVTVTMNGDANDLRIDGVPVSDYFE